MEFRRNDSEGAELYCTEQAAFTPFPSSSNQSRKHVASTPYHPAPLMSEKYDPQNQITNSSDDPILNDFRVIQYMMESEKNTDRTSSRYLRTTHVNDNMRKILLRWMYEVVIDQKCEELLFVLASNFLDRFLNSAPVEKGQLQLLGCCCLLLASKLRNSHIISADMLAYLTDGCHTDDDICKFELVVLSQLGWNMSPVLASDYLEPVIRQAGLSHVYAIQRHARSFLSMATLYSCFLDYRPSFLGCATVYAALTYCEGRDAEELVLLEFVEKNFGFSRQEMARARALIFSSMETELALQSDEDQETTVLPAFEDRRDGSSDLDTSCSEVSSSATFDVQARPLTIMSWLSGKAVFWLSSLLPLLGFSGSQGQQILDESQLKSPRGLINVRRILFSDWTPACQASMMVLLDILATGSKSSVYKRVTPANKRIPDITQGLKGDAYDRDENNNNVNFESANTDELKGDAYAWDENNNTVNLESDTSEESKGELCSRDENNNIVNFKKDAVIITDSTGVFYHNNFERDIKGNFINCINFEEERNKFYTQIQMEKY